tara:strand:- start:1007 stop:1552 length:546 start_codon:yes stop_codon:yes gene_type:complete
VLVDASPTESPLSIINVDVVSSNVDVAPPCVVTVSVSSARSTALTMVTVARTNALAGVPSSTRSPSTSRRKPYVCPSRYVALAGPDSGSTNATAGGATVTAPASNRENIITSTMATVANAHRASDARRARDDGDMVPRLCSNRSDVDATRARRGRDSNRDDSIAGIFTHRFTSRAASRRAT